MKMDNRDKCPICGRNCKIEPADKCFEIVRCDKASCFTFWIGDNLQQGDKREVNKRFNLVYEFLLRHPLYYKNGIGCYYKFFYAPDYIMKESDPPEYINVADLMKSYPITLKEKIDRILLNISFKYPSYGESITLYDCERMLFCENEFSKEKVSANKEVSAIWSMLQDFGYFSYEPNGLTAKGWIRIDELKKKSSMISQGFIAMAFRDETKFISDTFKKAISDCGYMSKRIDEKEHNNQIVPEIFYELNQSKFVVVDVTYPNYGAYYEAGYAQALGKEVIVCCRETEFLDKDKRPHFDISQKSMIVWKDENDLSERLKRRIEATVRE